VLALAFDRSGWRGAHSHSSRREDHRNCPLVFGNTCCVVSLCVCILKSDPQFQHEHLQRHFYGHMEYSFSSAVSSQEQTSTSTDSTTPSPLREFRCQTSRPRSPSGTSNTRHPDLLSQGVTNKVFRDLANQFSDLWCLKAVMSTVPAPPPTATSSTFGNPDSKRPFVNLKPYWLYILDCHKVP